MKTEIEDGVCYGCKAETDRCLVLKTLGEPIRVPVCAECDADGWFMREAMTNGEALLAGPLKPCLELWLCDQLAEELEAMARENNWPFIICQETGRKLYTKTP